MSTKREYAISLGLAKDGRGRMSKEAHAAIAKAESEGMTFDDSKTVEPTTKKPRESKRAPQKQIAEMVRAENRVREETVGYVYDNGVKIGLNHCRFGHRISYCKCETPLAPLFLRLGDNDEDYAITEFGSEK